MWGGYLNKALTFVLQICQYYEAAWTWHDLDHKVNALALVLERFLKIWKKNSGALALNVIQNSKGWKSTKLLPIVAVSSL